MIGIEQLSNKIAVFLADNIKDYTQISQILSTRRHKEYRLLNKQEVIEIFQYGLEGLLGEIVKTMIILVIGSSFHILLPSIFIMLSFCTLRLLAGGATNSCIKYIQI
jgi:accessory gene regulator protein AgrB